LFGQNQDDRDLTGSADLAAVHLQV